MMNFPVHIVAVSGLIRDEEGRVLMIRHPLRGWEYPGGQVENGEDLIAALKREVEEETGIRIRADRLAGVYSNTQTGVQYDGVSPVPTKLLFGFLGTSIGGELRTSEESAEVCWVPEPEAAERCANPLVKRRMADMLEFDGTVVYRSYTSKPYSVQLETRL